jgi:beta-galactosidase
MQKAILLYFLALWVPSYAWSQAEAPAPKVFPKLEKTMPVGLSYHPEQVPEKNWDADFARIAELGFSFIQIGEEGWSVFEPSEGRFDWLWLDRCLDLAVRYKLKVVLNTGTSSIPPWLLKKMPEIEATGADSKPYPGKRLRGSVCIPIYETYAEKLTTALAKRYGDNLAVAGWLVPCPPEWDFGQAARKAFQGYMKSKAAFSLDTLNLRWASASTGIIYSAWDEIRLPTMGSNGVAWQDFAHMQSTASQTHMAGLVAVLQRYTTEQFICPTYPLSEISGPYTVSLLPKQHITAISQMADLPSKGAMAQFALGQAFCRSEDYTAHAALPIGNDLSLTKPGEVRRMLWHQYAQGARFVCLKSEGRLGGLVEPDGLTLTRVALEVKETLIDFDVLRNILKVEAALPYGIARQQIAILANNDELAASAQNGAPQEEFVSTSFRVAKTLGCPVKFITTTKDLNPAEFPFLLIPAYQAARPSEVAQWKRYVGRGGHLIAWPGVALQKEANKPLGSALFPWFHFKIEEVYEPQSGDSSYITLGTSVAVGSSEILSVAAPFEDSTKVVARYGTPEYKGKPAVISANHGAGIALYSGTTSADGLLEQKLLSDLLISSGAKPNPLPEGVFADWHQGLWVVVNSSQNPYTPPPTIFSRDRVIGIGPTVLPGAVGVYKWAK